MGYSPQGHKQSNMTEATEHMCTLCFERGSVIFLDCRGWQELLFLLETKPLPPKGAALTSPQPRPFMPWVAWPWGLFRLFLPVSCPEGGGLPPGAWRLQAAPPHALWAGSAPLQTSLLATARMPSLPSVYFLSGWGPRSWKPCSHPLSTLPLEDQTHQG